MRDTTACTVKGCKTQSFRRRICRLHYDRLRKFGTIDLPPRPTLEERFWAKVDRTGECWVWTASLNSTGYGQFKVHPNPKAASLAHRVAYEIAVGPIPPGMEIDHRCHNQACVRPDHLRVVDSGQNKQNHVGARRDSASGIRGVHWDEREQRWHAQVWHRRTRVWSKYFISKEEAEAAVVDTRNRFHTHNDRDRAR